jgi:deoxycytidylate deaminase
MDCCRAIVQSGITSIVIDGEFYDQYKSPLYTEQFVKVEQMLLEAKINISVYHKVVNENV